MSQLKKEDISQEVFDLYDDYAHNKLTRKQFLEKLRNDKICQNFVQRMNY